MVIPDLSHPETSHRSERHEFRMAPVSDRLIAAVIDFLIMSPVISLIGSRMMNDIKVQSIVSENSDRLIIQWLIYLVFLTFSVITIQGTFLYMMQATPGQFFLKLRVVSYPHRTTRLTLGQSFLRSSLFALSGLIFCVPFLEVLGHPIRRAFHERASDTLVVTMKKQAEMAPLEIEQRYIASWISMFFLFVVFAIGGALVKTWREFDPKMSNSQNQSFEKKLACDGKSFDEVPLAKRLDLMITLLSLGELNEKCLDKEADEVLWNSRHNRNIAYFAKGMVTNGASRRAYFDKVCEDKRSEWCQLTAVLKDPSKSIDPQIIRKTGLQSVFARVLLLRHSEAGKNHNSALALIGDLRKEKYLADFIERAYVRNVWQLQFETRKPASDSDSVIDEFKRRYEVP